MVTREPAFNLQKTRIYLASSDSEIGNRAWADALNAANVSQTEGSAVRRRWETFACQLLDCSSGAQWKLQSSNNQNRMAQGLDSCPASPPDYCDAEAAVMLHMRRPIL